MGKIKTDISHNIKLPSGSIVKICNVRELDGNTQLTKNIKLWEWANNQAADTIKMILNDDVVEFATMVQELRGIYGKPFNFNSAYRTASYNKKVKGSSNSLHLQCRACDIAFPNLTDDTFRIIDEGWQKICRKHGKIGGINRYDNYIHIDNYEDFFGNKSYVHRDYRE